MPDRIVISVSSHAERRAKARLGWDFTTVCERAFAALGRVVDVDDRKPSMRCRHRGVDFFFTPKEDGCLMLLTVYRSADRRKETNDAPDLYSDPGDWGR